MTDWKNAYRDHWKHGNRRENKVKELIESWGFKVSFYGFHAGDMVYDRRHPKEKGIPDLRVEIGARAILIEVTGSKFIRGEDIWIRPDKFYYARNHPEQEVWIAHMVESTNLVRFVNASKKRGINIITVEIRDNIEIFVSLNKDDECIISAEQFKEYLHKV